MNQTIKLATAALSGIVATVIAGGIALASMHSPLGHFRGADANKNGEISRAEWLQTAATHFDALDANKDGKLVVGEIPPPRERGGPRHGRGPGGHDRWDREDQGPEADGNSM